MGFLGWVYETFVMTIWEGKWDNRGFLYGPMLPIYALGSLGVRVVFGILLPEHTVLQVFLIGLFGSMVLEFVTSWVLEHFFHRTWWDYSIVPFNVQGRICPPASIGFGVAALLLVYIVNPQVFALLDRIPTKVGKMLSALYALLVLADLCITVYNLKLGHIHIPGYSRINERMEDFVENHRLTERSISERLHDRVDR